MRGIAMSFMTSTHVIGAEAAAGMAKRRSRMATVDFVVMAEEGALLPDFMAAVAEPSAESNGAAIHVDFPRAEGPALVVAAAVDSMAGADGVRIQRRPNEYL